MRRWLLGKRWLSMWRAHQRVHTVVLSRYALLHDYQPARSKGPCAAHQEGDQVFIREVVAHPLHPHTGVVGCRLRVKLLQALMMHRANTVCRECFCRLKRTRQWWMRFAWQSLQCSVARAEEKGSKGLACTRGGSELGLEKHRLARRLRIMQHLGDE